MLTLSSGAGAGLRRWGAAWTGRASSALANRLQLVEDLLRLLRGNALGLGQRRAAAQLATTATAAVKRTILLVIINESRLVVSAPRPRMWRRGRGSRSG